MLASLFVFYWCIVFVNQDGDLSANSILCIYKHAIRIGDGVVLSEYKRVLDSRAELGDATQP